MSEKQLFSAAELEIIGIRVEESEQIDPFLLPLQGFKTAVYGEKEIPLDAGVILPDMQSFWKTSGVEHEDVAVLEADEVLVESEDSVDQEEDDAITPAGNAARKAPPPVSAAEEPARKVPPPVPAAEEPARKAPPPVPAAEEPARKAPPPVPAKEPRPVEPNWSDTFFDDDYVSMQEHPSSKKTLYDVEFLISQLQLAPGMKVLDVGCADGRHALGLASRGMQASGIDTSVAFLLQANQMAQELGQNATFIKKDMREYTPTALQDAVICFGGSFGYFSDAENAELVKRFASWLVPGGKLLLDVMHRDYVVSQLPTRVWWEGNGCMVMDECYFQYPDNRLLVKRNTVFANGKQRNYQITIRAYTLREITDIVEAAGFKILSISGSVYTPGAFTGLLSPSIILVLQK